MRTDFLWPVFRYRWQAVTVEAADSLYLLVPESSAGTFREYAPLDQEQGLFRNFAGLEFHRDAILAFANQYGHLGLNNWGPVLVNVFEDPLNPDSSPQLPSPSIHDPLHAPAESFDDWKRSIGFLREAVALWDQFKNDPKGDQDLCVLEVRTDRMLSREARLTFGSRRGGQGLVLQVKPKSLLGAMWLQLALAVSEDKQHRACANCGKWFEVSLHGARKSRKHCSEACKASAYRSRKENAVKLAAKGLTVDEIAAELDCKAASIRQWLDIS